MVSKIIIADSGPLIAFSKIQKLPLLKKTLGAIIVPEAVFYECVSNQALPGAKGILNAVDNKIIQVHENPDTSLDNNLFDVLGKGEVNAIILATFLKAGLLIDDKLGRKTAQKKTLKVIGTAGVLLLAKEKKLIKTIAPLVNELKNSGYYLSNELINSILLKSNEKQV